MAVANGLNSSPPCKKIKLSTDRKYQNGNNLQNGSPEKRNSSIERKSLPVYCARKKIIEIVQKNSTTIIIGETGCGKTTQIPQFVYEENLHKNGVIGVTQPRRVAAISLAHRVADETNCELGKLVGYSVRFDSLTSGETKIQYLTDGMMLREAIRDPVLRRFSVVILDEAHERTLHTDVMFGVVKLAQKLRKQNGGAELKIIVMSATMDVDAFSLYFNSAPVVYVEGRQYPIQLMYTALPVTDYIHATLVTIFQLHRQQPVEQDFLVFLTGQDEIEQVVRKCREVTRELPPTCPKAIFIPLYAALTSQAQMKIFEPRKPNVRKIILSTNLAETSITVPGVMVVIDSCKVKMRIYEPTKGIDMLRVTNVSKAQACQRSGRAGRDGPGLCYRLFREADYDKLLNITQPEILRCSLSTVILEMLAMQINDINDFDFMDKPKSEAISSAIKELKYLNAIEETNDKNIILTNLGKKMSHFPLDPKLSRIIFAAEKLGCLEEALTVVSLMSSESVLVSQSVKKEECECAHRKFFAPEGDLIFLLNIYKAYKSSTKEDKLRNWCQENFIHQRHLSTVEQVRSQLKEICIQQKMSMSSCGINYNLLRKAICHGLFLHTAELDGNNSYKLLDGGINASIHPSSCLFQHKPGCIVYLDLMFTNQLYLRDVTVVDPKWLIEIAPEFFRSKHLHGV